jgi:hypothetical protein
MLREGYINAVVSAGLGEPYDGPRGIIAALEAVERGSHD